MGHRSQELQEFPVNHLKTLWIGYNFGGYFPFQVKNVKVSIDYYYQSKLQNISKTEKIGQNYEILFPKQKLWFLFETLKFWSSYLQNNWGKNHATLINQILYLQ